ncbi:MAG: hypothetical protein C5S49_03435 [Candidatus Methanogaster sp.]|nr:MAG: hypothetical protein C5S49_03435 [ANME-2 cluster archaeon]
MRLRIISSKEEIGKLDSAEELVHLTFRPSNTDVVALIKKCPNLLAVHLPSSYKRTMSKSATMFLSANNTKLLTGNLRGHRKDIDQYHTVSDAIISEILDHQKNGLHREEIVRKAGRNSGLSPDLINHIADVNSERLNIPKS